MSQFPKFPTKKIKEIFIVIGIVVRDYLPYSPNPNPIENLWAFLKATIYNQDSDLQHALKKGLAYQTGITGRMGLPAILVQRLPVNHTP
jgi:hypothetical protein